jgi:lipoprotein-releasing system ATP-binding protein
MNPILKAEHLKKTFLRPKRLELFTNISLSIEPGESIAICGRSGDGKTTLLHVFGTLEEPDVGELYISGIKATKQNAHLLRLNHIGFVFQAFNLLEDFTALDNTLMPSRIKRDPVHKGSASYARAAELLHEVGLGDHLHTPAKLLSGGERQRVAIARALVNNPELILADEPSGNLDRANAQRIGELLLNCTLAKKKGLILVTHDQDLAKLCQKTYQLQSGKLIRHLA